MWAVSFVLTKPLLLWDVGLLSCMNSLLQDFVDYISKIPKHGNV